MSESHSDALVFFGATGDLAYKKIFPALHAMVKRGHLNVPVIGVAKSGWSLEQLQERVHDSLEKHGGVDTAAFAKLSGLLRYVDGDYADPATFQAIRKELDEVQRPATAVRSGRGTAGEIGVRPRRPRDCREALRQRSRLRPGAQPDFAWNLPRVGDFSH